LQVMLDTYITETDYFMCISECTKRDLLAYSKKILPDHCFVIPLAAASYFKPCTNIDQITDIKTKYYISGRYQYILSVCTLEPRKNLLHLVRSFITLIQSEQIDDLVLVLTGAKGWLIDDLFEEVEDNELLRQRLVMTGYVDDEELSPLYSGALAFVYPSLYEGFGLPPLEAMQCGTPVICSNTSSLPEVVGDAGILVDPHDQSMLVKSLMMLYTDKEKREHYSKLGIERAKCFSWEKTGEMVYDMYRKVLNRSSSD
jgi:glycosyltransferase involved in cell wall biosynthesis